MLSAMWAKPFTIFAAEGLGGKRQNDLLAQDILQQDTILLIIPDFGLGGGNGMLRSVAVGPGRAKEQVELAGERMLDRVEAAGAEHLEAAGIGGAHPDVVDQLIRSPMLDDQVGAALDSQRIELMDVEAVLDAPRLKGQVEFGRFFLELNNRKKHGGGHRG